MDDSLDDGSTVSPPSTLSKALQTTVLCPTFVANLLGNICVCFAVARLRSLGQRPDTSILVSLAISDFSLSSFLLFRLIWLYDYAPVTSKIIIPLSYRDRNSSRFKTSMIGCLESDMKTNVGPSLVHKFNIAFNVSFLIAIPFAVVVFVYARIAKISWSQSNRVEPGENLNPETAERRKKERKEMKWMKIIVMVIGAFALCHLTSLIYVILSATLSPSQVPEPLRTSAILLTGMNSALNQMIYMLGSNEFKRAFRKCFRRASNEPNIINNTTLRARLSCAELSSRDPRNDRPQSFLSVPNENATSTEPKSESTVTVQCNWLKT